MNRGEVAARPGGAIAVLLAAAFLGIAICACSRPRATEADCRAILDRIIAIELRELGYRDRAVVSRRQEELATSLAGSLAGCVGRPLPKGAMDCVAAAQTTEELSHDCLR